MPFNSQRVDMKSCKKVHPPHPCDTYHCDPLAEPEGDCPSPSLCLEKVKNPALPGEITRCQPGAYMNVSPCAKEPPPHPCDDMPPCSKAKKKAQCVEPALCYERIKNPEPKKPYPPGCDPTK